MENQTKKKLCPVTLRELPESLAGFQLLCNSRVAEGDLIIDKDSMPGEGWMWAAGLVGAYTDEEGYVDECARVYRRIPVPKPGDHDINPSTGKTYGEMRGATPGLAPGERLCPHPTRFDAAHDTWVPTVPGPRSALPTTAADRKGIPVTTGFIDYFPDAMAEVARLSKVGNDQHNPGQPLHWDKSKSTDEADALVRHLIDRGTFDTDGVRHSAKVAWRAMALLQREIDAERAAK